MTIALHPGVDHGVKKGTENFAGGTLRCQCAHDPVEVQVASQVMFNHACGCTKCWKPAGALFSVVGVVPREKVSVLAHGEKLRVVDDKALIQRHACTACGAHLFGRIENKDHAFHGLDFIHTELSGDAGWEGPGFAAFVSSIIESGTPPSQMAQVRQTLRDKGLEPYDCLSPALMDALATHAAKAKGTYREA
ncbi:MAG: S-(hydroxymethyl)glutathione synthase [Paraburkholderia sp.]|jgi:S-(hydroxymethyl)glutathione synthase|nr:S-(hydroxymethyl)glutathione synthase [Paraburkholderia sp.]